MIVAVANYVEGNISTPPIELRYVLQSQSYGGLPNPGGLRDQPAGLMIRMSAVYNVWTAFSKFKSAGFDPKWIQNNSELWEIVTEVETLKGKMQEAKEGNI